MTNMGNMLIRDRKHWTVCVYVTWKLMANSLKHHLFFLICSSAQSVRFQMDWCNCKII